MPARDVTVAYRIAPVIDNENLMSMAMHESEASLMRRPIFEHISSESLSIDSEDDHHRNCSWSPDHILECSSLVDAFIKLTDN